MSALSPTFSLFDSVAERTAARAGEGTQLVSRAMDTVADAIVAGASRVTQIVAASGSRAGTMLLDAAATALQQKSLAALSRLSTFVSAHIARLGTWASGELRGALGFIVGGFKAAGALFSTIWGGLKSAFSTASGAVSTVGSVLLRSLAPLWEAVTGAVTFAASHLLSAGSWLAQRLAGALGLVWGVLTGIIGHVVSALGGVIGTVSGWIDSAMAGLRRRILDFVVEIGVAVGKLIGGLIQFIDSLLASIPIAGPVIQIGLAVGGLLASAFLLAKTSALLSSGLSLAAHTLTGLGTTLAGGVTSLGKTVWAGLSGAGKAASSWFSSAASGAGRMVAGLGAGASNAWSTALGAGSRLLGSGSGTFGGLLTVVTRVMSNLVPQLLAFGQAVLTLVGVGAAVGTFAVALNAAIKSTMEYAKQSQLLAAQSGLTFQTAARVLRGLNGLGIQNAPDGDSAIFRLKAGVFGLPGYDDSRFAERLAARFQSMQSEGFGGRMMAQGMMKSLGLTSPEWMRTAMTSPSKIAAQNNYVSGVNRALSISPADLKAYAEDVPLLIERIGATFDAVKVKLATTALPIVNSLLGNVTNWLAANAGKIGGWIQMAVSWIFVKAPLLAMNAVTTIVSSVQRAVNGVFQFGQILVQKLPSWLGGVVTFIAGLVRSSGALLKTGADWVAGMIDQGTDWVARAISNFIVAGSKGLASFGHMVADWVRTLSQSLTGLSTKDNPLRSVVETFASVYDSIVNNTRSFQASMLALAGSIPFLLKELLQGGIVTALGPIAGKPIQDFIDSKIAVEDPISIYNNAMAKTQASDLTGRVGKLFDTAIPNYGKAGLGIASRMDSYWENFEKHAQARGDRVANFLTSPMRAASGGIAGFGNWAQARANSMGDMLDPARGKGANFGTAIGQSVANAISPGLGFLESTVKPGIESISDFVSSYKSALGNEQERNVRLDELIRINKQQLDLMREQYRNTGSFGAGADRVMAIVEDLYAQRSAAALRTT